MAELFSKDEDLPRSAPAIGYEILKMLHREDRNMMAPCCPFSAVSRCLHPRAWRFCPTAPAVM